MNPPQDKTTVNPPEDAAARQDTDFGSLYHLSDDKAEAESKIIPMDKGGAVPHNALNKKGERFKIQTGPSKKDCDDGENGMLHCGLFRLFVKNGQYVYARPEDIIMIESCDHLVKVYLGIGGKVRLTVRHNTLKDFLEQLPENQFVRIGRFCAINTRRLSGGNCSQQVFEFDYSISIKLKHSVSNTVFTRIGK